MADQFLTKAGAVVKLKKGKSASLISIKQLFPKGGRLAKKNSKGCAYGYLLTGLSYEKEDIVVPIAAVDKSRVLYSSGQNFGHFTVEGIIFFGSSSVLKQLDNAFSKVRVSERKKPKTATGLGMPNTKVFVTKMTVFGADPDIGAVRFGVECVVAPVTNKR